MPKRFFTCEICGKPGSETTDLKGFKIDNEKEVELEYFNVHDKCGRKEMKKQKLKLRIANAIDQGIISKDLFDGYKAGIISQKDFIETLQHAEKTIVFKETKKEVI